MYTQGHYNSLIVGGKDLADQVQTVSDVSVVCVVIDLGVPDAATDHLQSLNGLLLLDHNHHGHNLVARQVHFSLHSLSHELGQLRYEGRKLVEVILPFFHMFFHYRTATWINIAEWVYFVMDCAFND